MTTLTEELVVLPADLLDANQNALQTSLEALLSQLDSDSTGLPLRDRHRLWLLRGVVLRLLGKISMAIAQFETLAKAAPARTLVIQAAAMLELCETLSRQGEAGNAKQWLAKACSFKTVNVCSKTEAKRLPEARRQMLRTRIHEARGYLAALAYDPQEAIGHVRQALRIAPSQLQQQQCRSLLVKLHAGEGVDKRSEEERVRSQITSPLFLRERDQWIYKEIWELTTEPMEEVVSL